MTNTVLANYRIWTANSYQVKDVDIKLNLIGLNYATFTCPVRIEAPNAVTITYENQDVFSGTVSQCKRLNRTIDGITVYDIEAVEYAAELQTKYVTTASTTGLYIRNDQTEKKTLGYLIGLILSSGGATDWVDVSDASTKALTQVTYDDGDVDIPSFGFSTCTVYNALKRIIVDIFGLGLWFEYTDGQKRLRYGENNSTATGFPIPTSIKVTEKAVNGNIDGIVVYGQDKSIYVTMGNMAGKVMAFRYATATSTSELNGIAARVFADKNQVSYRYEIEFPAGWYNVREGDLITIGDSSIGLNTEAHGVKDVRFTMTKTTVSIGAAAVTIFDIMAEKLAIVDNDILYFTQYDIDTGLFTVNPASGGAGEWGTTVTVGGEDGGFFVEGKTLMDNITIYPYFEDADSGAGTTVFSIGAATSSVTVGATAATLSYAGVLDPDWFPWDWQWVTIEARYSMSSVNASGSIIAWDLNWPGVNLTEDGTDYQTLSTVRGTSIHRWYIGQTYGAELNVGGVETNYPVFTMTHEGSGTSVTILDLVVNIIWHYDVGGGSGSLTSAPTAELQVVDADGTACKINDEYGWTVIFDSANPSAYTSASYDVDTNGATGAHYFKVRMKNDAAVNCQITGSYIAFDEQTTIER
jgi:hypothetical protein